MSLYVQHGHGKSSKIDEALDEKTVQGVILAPRNEKPDNLKSYASELLRRQGCQVMIDPQTYISTLSPANTRYLTEYSYYCHGLSASDFTLKRIRGLVQRSLEFQRELGVSAVIAPTVLFDSFTDRWHQIALNLADASLEEQTRNPGSPPLLLSFVFGEAALTAVEELNRFLDTVTQDEWNMQGFYFVVAREEPTYNQDWDSARLANLLYLVHVLGHINRLRVIVGYTDFAGLILRAAGASAFASGWSHGLRHFARKSFLHKPAGGQTPRVRYSSGPLLSSIFIQELQDIFDFGCLRSVLSEVPLDREIMEAPQPQAAAWNANIAQLQHWQTLHKLNEVITGRHRDDFARVLGYVRNARALYTTIERTGVQFDRFTGKDHLSSWLRALVEFGGRTGIPPSS